MNIASIAYLSKKDLITYIQKVNKNNTGSDQWDRKETNTKQFQQIK